jgi:hypothetical protein
MRTPNKKEAYIIEAHEIQTLGGMFAHIIMLQRLLYKKNNIISKENKVVLFLEVVLY